MQSLAIDRAVSSQTTRTKAKPAKKVLANKSARLEARLQQSKKDVIAQAAAIAGFTITEFTVNSTYENATKIIEREKLLSLSQEDSKIFVDALNAPPAPSKRLQQAARTYLEGQSA